MATFSFSRLFLYLRNGQEAQVDAFVAEHLRTMLARPEHKTVKTAVRAALTEMKAAAEELRWEEALIEQAFGAYGRGVGDLIRLAIAEGVLDIQLPQEKPSLSLV